MSLSRLIRLLAEKRRLDRALRLRRIARQFRSEAAHRGVSTETMRRAERARAILGGKA